MLNEIQNDSPVDLYPELPSELKALERWGVYKMEWNALKKKWDKPPYNARTGTKGNPIDPQNQTDYQTACSFLRVHRDFMGAGFGLEYSDGYTCIDFDDCVDDWTLEITPQVLAIIRELNSYAEFSPNETGVHIWVKGWQVPGDKQGCRNGYAEMYSGRHYMTVTGRRVPEAPPDIACRDLSALYQRILAGEFKNKTAEGATEPAVAAASDNTKKEAVPISFGGHVITTKLRLLMDGTIVPGSKPFVVSDAYGNSIEYPSQSEADQALCNCLAIEFEGDESRIDEEFRKSVLYRDKWERKDYRENTIKRAINSFKQSLSSFVEVTSNAAPAMDDVTKPMEIKNVEAADMPDTVLCGRLGEIYQERLSIFPIAYAWPSLLTAAGVLVPPSPPAQKPGLIFGDGDEHLTNLYTGLVGPVHSGKSQAIEWGAKILNVFRTARYTEVKAGSAEGLFKKVKRDREHDKLRDQVLVNLDEWSHFFSKAGIDGASFSRLLTTGFYRRKHQLVIARGQEIEVDCMLSWIGGIVDEQYEDCFNSSTIGGLYDRFVHGVCPTGYVFDYRPFEGGAVLIEPVPVEMDRSVWEATGEWRKENPDLGREIELAVRVAKICASMDGRKVLRGEDMIREHKAFTDYQAMVRKRLKPNPGDNPDAVFSNAVLGWLQRHAPNGEWVRLRDLKRAVSYNRMRLGPGVAERAISNLARFEDIQIRKEVPSGTGRPPEYVRLNV